MSFNSKSPRRYGHVPPVQYGSASRQDQNYTAHNVQRQSDYNNGNKLTTLDLFSDQYDMALPAVSRSPTPPQREDICTAVTTTPERCRFSRSEFFEKNGSSSWEYKQQDSSHQTSPRAHTLYDSQDVATAPSMSQVSLHRAQQSQSLRIPYPRPYVQPVYHSSQSSFVLERPTEYYSNTELSYDSGLDSLSSTQLYQNTSFYDCGSTSSSYEPPKLNPILHTGFSSASGSLRPTAHINTVSPIATYHREDNYLSPTTSRSPVPENDDFLIRTRIESLRHNPEHHNTYANCIQGSPESVENIALDESGLRRHPTFRPLPSAPVYEDEQDEYGGSSPESYGRNLEQEQLFADIGVALGASEVRSQRPLPLSQQNSNPPHSELHRFEPRYVNMTGESIDKKISPSSNIRFTYYDDEDDDDGDEGNESDLEAAAGLEAMRIADEQDLYCCAGVPDASIHDRYQLPRQISGNNLENDNDELVDLSSASANYDDFVLPYKEGPLIGNNVDLTTEEREQILPALPLHEINGTTPSSGHSLAMRETSDGNKNPSVTFDTKKINSINADEDKWLSSRGPRLSFDEGDEQLPLYSQPSNEPEISIEPRDEMLELFYHPGTGSSPYKQQTNSERPLPTPPTIVQNLNIRNSPAQSYKSLDNESTILSRADFQYKSGFIAGTDSYATQDSTYKTGQYIPRCSSLLSHSTTPQMAPPVRSKTDAEERQLRGKNPHISMHIPSGLQGYETGSPQSLHSIDLPSLPAGRQRKFSPSRLTSKEFLICKEPWALSSIASWIREVTGANTGEGESDLRTRAIEDGIVALFTYMVPMMNTADAETLSQRVLSSMLNSGLLVREEEWVRFGDGEISGVLWQLTGSGCYSPKVHEYELHGRCYSYHCTRTLKKINLQTQVLEPARNSEDWITFHKLKISQIEGVSKKEIQRQNNLHEIVMSEDLYMDQINILRILYRDELSTWEPPIIAKEKIAKFIGAVFGKVEAIKVVNESYLLAQLKYRQKEQGPWISGFSDIFREWIRKAKAAYIEYAAGFPNACYLVRREADKNILFRQFLDQARDNKLSNRLDWNTYLKAPITRLLRYTLLLGTVHCNMIQESEEKSNLALAIEEIKAVAHECDAKVDEQTKKVEMLELRSKLILRPGMSGVELNLDHLGRTLIFQGDLQRAGGKRFTWLETHAILLDNYLILSKTISKGESMSGRKKEAYDVSKLPIPMQLLVLKSTNDDPVVKSSVKGIAAVTTVGKTGPLNSTSTGLNRSSTDVIEKSTALEKTISNQSTTTLPSLPRHQSNSVTETDARLMYPFRVKHLGKAEIYTLYAPSAQSRMEWCEKILEAKTQFTASLHEQNADPFELRVIADCAFALDSLTVSPQKSDVSVSGTPLDRAIREIESIYGPVPRPAPVCRAQVNCATSFNLSGRTIVAIGTDYGVYVSEDSDPRGWTRSIQISRVTQIAVLEEFLICLIIADKALIAYPLDFVMPPSEFSAPPQESTRRAPMKLSGTRDVSFFATSRMKNRTLIFYKKREGLHSTFKVLEPVYQKSSEKLSRLLGKLKIGTTEFFRAYDEFYIPTECFTINLFHSYIAISTLKGFELMTLDKKVPMSIPDTRDPAITSITARLAGQKPLGMFRLSSVEFLLCYEECGVYVDKHGDVSRSVIMEFVGKAKTAAMYDTYLVLFDNDFVEVRNAENGRLRQIIAGRDVRCLDSGVNPLGIGATSNETEPIKKRTLKFVMAHPEVNGSQLVLEMELNQRCA
ncbi:Rho1 guanine nucleotide exchange factor 3 [Golovinomyces cichoracearum]|uniref:Rho1 guanine nucleotide exchange factor 3 n=1 Tax=Golovinomyces cichoracearum TaxID=62708 RepID=A0A420IFN1_9PEZI|nr:Rho1 guanine nucleotide exchange factor 3 [Golovinomyces cichoracearum]